MRLHRRKSARESGSAAVEFAFIAPVLILAVLSMADIGLAIHQSSQIDQTLRNGAQVALTDPGEAAVREVLSAVDQSGDSKDNTVWTIERYCACPESPQVTTACSTTCGGERPTSIFYSIQGVRAYPGIFLPARELVRSAGVHVR